jgi:hypothetical protein
MRSALVAFAFYLPFLARAVDFRVVQWDCADPISGDSDVTQIVRLESESGCSGCGLDTDSNPWTIDSACDYDFSFDSDALTFSATNPTGGETKSGTCVDSGGTDVCQTVSAACAEWIEYDCSYD